jgi:hypothetical protein
MRSPRLAALALGAALAACAAPAAAQQPAPQQKAAPQKLTPQQQLERQQQQQKAAVHYDTYEASRRRRARAAGCQPESEDMLGAYCIRKCRTGYVATDDKKASQRECRSVKPLPPGQVPASGQKEVSTQVVPKLPRTPLPPGAPRD